MKKATSALDSMFPHLNLLPLVADSSAKSFDLSICFFTMPSTRPGATMLAMLATRSLVRKMGSLKRNRRYVRMLVVKSLTRWIFERQQRYIQKPLF